MMLATFHAKTAGNTVGERIQEVYDAVSSPALEYKRTEDVKREPKIIEVESTEVETQE